MTQRLATGITFYRESFGDVLSDLRSPGSVCRPAGVVFVRTWDRKVEIYDMFRTPGTYVPPTGFVAMTPGTYVRFIIVGSGKK